MLRISHEALTFDDVLLVPGYSDVTAKDVATQTQLTRGITMNIPLVSAAMDTVTESRLAIAIAQEGGVGIVHKSMTIEEQAKQVWAVKKYESGVVKDPFTIESSATLAGSACLHSSEQYFRCADTRQRRSSRHRNPQRRALCHRYGCLSDLGDDA